MSEQVAMAVPAELAVGATPLQQLEEVTLHVVTHIQTALMERRQHIADKWGELSRLQRAAYRVGATVTSAVGATLLVSSFRATGAVAHGLEDSGLLHSVSSGHTSASSGPAMAEHLTTLDLVSAADTDSMKLPADIDKAPGPFPLGHYDRHTGDGTVWNQAVDYAGKLGYTHLTEHQKWLATSSWLKANHLSWADARRLPSNYEPHAPSQRAMEHLLDQHGAHRAVAPDRAPAPVIHVPAQPHNNPPAASAACHTPPFAVNNPLHDCQWNSRDAWFAAGLAGVLVVARGGQNALNRGRREHSAQRLATAQTAQQIIINPNEVAARRAAEEAAHKQSENNHTGRKLVAGAVAVGIVGRLWEALRNRKSRKK